MKTPDQVNALLRDVFAILDSIESNEEGTNEFRPTYITSCRVMDSMRLAGLLSDLREHVGLPRVPPEPNEDRCECCNGEGEHSYDIGDTFRDIQVVKCTECNGTGRI